MAEMLKNQRFGVEVEFTGITREIAAKVVAEVLGTTRISRPAGSPYFTRVITDSKNRKWKVMRDSSIDPERTGGLYGYLDEFRVEFVTPPLHYEDIDTLQTIIRKFREVGGKANSSCGIHIHVDGANHTPLSLRRMVNFMASRQDLLYEALNIGARKDSWCKPISKELLSTMKRERNFTSAIAEQIWYSSANDSYSEGIDHSHYNRTRYHGLNLHSYFSKGTVEFRLFNSTLHAGKIKAYIQFCLAVSAWAIESNDRVVFKNVDNYSADKKVTLMRSILINRLGLSGDEFKTCRLHMMKKLKENATPVAA